MSDIQEEASPLKLPSEQEQVKLVNESMRIFAESVNEQSMERFHPHLSIRFQQQFSVSALDQAFSEFYELGLDLTIFQKFPPMFSQAASVTETGDMLINGFYPTTPNQIHFEQMYTFEGQSWKVVSFHTSIKKDPFSLERPSDEVLVKLIYESVLVFAEAVCEKSMEKFHAYISVVWQQQFSIQKLDEAYQAFYALDLDLTVLKDFSPIFSNPPSIGDDGMLLITGFFPTTPQRFHFTQRYVYEGTSWKLAGFGGHI